MGDRMKLAAIAGVVGALCLVGCAPVDGGVTTQMPTASADPFEVDVQVPYITVAPQTTVDPSAAQDERTIDIDSNGKVTVLRDTWNDYLASEEDQAGYYTQLRLGDEGDEVRNIQTRLAELGYYAGVPSGTFDQATQDALMAFEGKYYDQCHGVATARLQALLFAPDAIYNENTRANDEPDADDGVIEPPEEFVELAFGDESEDVRMLQRRLDQLGYLEGNPTGVYDYYTCCAVMRFEASYDRELTGVATESMQEYVYKEEAIPMNGERDRAGTAGRFLPTSQGDDGALVALVQQRLKDLGYSDASPNGKFNKYTAELLKVFQEQAALEATGEADAETQLLLFGESAPRGEVAPEE